jgi:hypothetical protein
MAKLKFEIELNKIEGNQYDMNTLCLNHFGGDLEHLILDRNLTIEQLFEILKEVHEVEEDQESQNRPCY